ncbi:sulfatase-like hydrolase/transferase [Helcococcus kunzii]|uniref:Sulfatase N-terminal domain-containing protein n=2 Tax=Helcococcus kunzii TaxID=40091 RepID=H3NL98_9FIRM|nr:sulfatase-like hydrolase/transferase [Helcococcus kunzii]EHR36079.1 hypothetical protein HMPREF9709_00175 [Helcococcus kunzii ATCC 51366]MCT1796653.1 sulfatase-like hydrolase/transferase [Helcococcus kunzii]MCT1988703.1 sulfatase-like hydrolase/transferase [Helcococcus kunzii]QUY64113.1 sulfatase-like hydrolase/transferase [Helcococcus kunzii]
MKKNILLYFTDQQRWDTLGSYGYPLDVSPVVDELAEDGVLFENAFSPQPVCGPLRSIFQSGQYPTTIGTYRNNIMLPHDIKTLANYMEDLGYENAYVGKWHLASQADPQGNFEYYHSTTAIPMEFRGGYKGFWRVADALEETSHGYDGYVFDENNNKLEFKGYRVDKITDFGLEFFDQYDKEKPFFLTISHIEPHHQNDRHTYEGPEGSKERFKDYVLPKDLEVLSEVYPQADAHEEYPDYLGQIRSIDDNLGRIIDRLKKEDLFDNTVIIFISDHGSHFKTRNNDEHLHGADDYKRTAHASASHVPFIIYGPGFKGGKRIDDIISTASLPKTILSIAGYDVGDKMIGEDLTKIIDGSKVSRNNLAFIQISESRVGRAIRTEDYLYAVYAPGKDGFEESSSDYYLDDYLYDLKKDPFELNNVVHDEEYSEIRDQLCEILKEEMVKAGEKKPTIDRK